MDLQEFLKQCLADGKDMTKAQTEIKDFVEKNYPGGFCVSFQLRCFLFQENLPARRYLSSLLEVRQCSLFGKTIRKQQTA